MIDVKGVQMSELTISEAVRVYEVHPNVLSRMILMGRVKGRKNVNGHWLITKDSLEDWNRRRVRRAPKRQEEPVAAIA